MGSGSRSCAQILALRLPSGDPGSLISVPHLRKGPASLRLNELCTQSPWKVLGKCMWSGRPQGLKLASRGQKSPSRSSTQKEEARVLRPQDKEAIPSVGESPAVLRLPDGTTGGNALVRLHMKRALSSRRQESDGLAAAQTLSWTQPQARPSGTADN